MKTVTCLVLLAFILSVESFVAWLFMVAFNLVAGYFGWKQITFWVAFAIMFLLGLVAGFFRGGAKK